MANRLIEREQEAQTTSGYVSPAPVAPAPAPAAQVSPQQKSAAMLPVGVEIPTVLLANHVIEPELLGVTPRCIESNLPSPLYAYLHVLTFPVYFFYLMWHKNPEIAWLLIFPAAVLASIGVYIWYANKPSNCTQSALRYGLPHRTFVELVSKLSSSGGSHTVTYWYADAAGEWVCGTVDVPSATVALLGIAPGYIFTLLVSPHGEGKPLPYFMATAYRVVPVVATPVSQDVSLRVAAVEAERLAATAKQSGTFGTIEPELLQTTPRQVRHRKRYFQQAQMYFALFSVLATLVILYATYVQPLGTMFWAIAISQILGQIVVYLKRPTGRVLTPAQYLAFGTPTRALVTHEENTTPNALPVEKHSIVYRYKYESADGKVHTGWLTVPRSRVWQLGLRDGATFTVLPDVQLS